ncbi:hypothetical protein SEA_TEATEALATTE_66 [Gordonia phage Teatealatte]|uniref:Uncharacterized protein n=2 Tax=Demosthenesvirus katyusha TaxID=1982108 RepID=A0A345MCA3_9CAUD|nr:hypothetical protein SEA_TEATEALATTE_66 [Gordonia phage Teatealatte]QBP29622.1 hypothetical protein SEA_TREDGE_65 [Gordonia phage Tredge]
MTSSDKFGIQDHIPGVEVVDFRYLVTEKFLDTHLELNTQMLGMRAEHNKQYFDFKITSARLDDYGNKVRWTFDFSNEPGIRIQMDIRAGLGLTMSNMPDIPYINLITQCRGDHLQDKSKECYSLPHHRATTQTYADLNLLPYIASWFQPAPVVFKGPIFNAGEVILHFELIIVPSMVDRDESIHTSMVDIFCMGEYKFGGLVMPAIIPVCSDVDLFTVTHDQIAGMLMDAGIGFAEVTGADRTRQCSSCARPLAALKNDIDSLLLVTKHQCLNCVVSNNDSLKSRRTFPSTISEPL